jgi:pimeloyl-ACP methyl ester carboxylesterase
MKEILMTNSTSTCFAMLVLLIVLPSHAQDLKNPGFDNDGGWRIITEGSSFSTAFTGDSVQSGQKSFGVSLAWETPTKPGEFAGIEQVVEFDQTCKGLSFFVKDGYTGDTARYHWMEFLLDDEVIWEEDLAGGKTGWRKISLDLTRYLKEAKRVRIGRDKYRAETNYKITFRVYERRGVRRFGADVNVDSFELLKASPDNPQNCERKKASPVLSDLLVYYDDEDLFQQVTKPGHFSRKREQILAGMLEGMGELPARPVRAAIDEFNIRILDTQIRGRYKKKTIVFDVGNGEVVHAFLYEPLELKAGERRPGIVGMHPTGSTGKASFESWPLCNFPIELAMMGYVVIVPDYPGFGDSRPYDFEADRYESGTIKGVYNHMACVDLLQLHPQVAADKIGAIGHSLGGHNAMFLAAFDERVKIAVSSCGWTPFEYYETKKGRLKTWALPKYMPLLDTRYDSDHRKFPFDFHEVAAAISPRVFFSSSPTGDGVFPGWGPKAAESQIRAFFKARGSENDFQFHQPLAQHRFPWNTRQAAYRSMNDAFDYHFHGELGLHSERNGTEAIPRLKLALNHVNPQVRWAAADMLATLNDSSGLERMKLDFAKFSADPTQSEHALEVAKVLAQLGNSSGYRLSANLAVAGTTQGQRWRAAVALAHLCNLDSRELQAASKEPVSVLKTMAADEKHEGVFFVLVDQVHKILKNRDDMIDIFAIAKESKHHVKPPPGNRFRMAEIFYDVAVRDREKTWR